MKGVMRMKRLKNHDGFSMVELIIVIAIMAILAGALAPTLIKYVNKSRITSDLNTASEIAKATQLALVDKEVADYVFNQPMPYSVDVENLNSADVFENFILEKLGTTPRIQYKKNGATCFQITIYELSSDGTSHGVEVTAKGAPVTSTSGVAASPKGGSNAGAMLYPDADDQYK